MALPKRKIAVFTGNRAEYGLQYPVLRAIAAHPDLDYYLIAGGSHLQEDFGKTVVEIEGDGMRVHRHVEIQMHQDTPFATAEAIGSGVVSLSGILNDLRPDILVVYGDRYESLSAMIAGTQMNIPTAHIEGGDYTEGGALDDSVRHAMTKLAHLHFTTNEHAAERVRRLGEESWRISNVGLPVLDLVAAGLYASPQELAPEFGLDLARPIILFCQHSIATEFEQAADQVRPSLEALADLSAEGYQSIITYPNNDAGGQRIVEEIQLLEKRRLPNIKAVKSLGRRRFHGMMNILGREGHGAFVGNSSAGIKETPIFGCPAVNIGQRQQGRLRSSNVLDAPYDGRKILAAIRRCVEDVSFRNQCRTCDNPYGVGDSGARIAETLASTKIDPALIQKKMTF